MSFRDDLEPEASGKKSEISIWLESQDSQFQQEFNEVLFDTTVNHSRMWRAACKNGMPMAESTFSTWRKKQWASKTI